MAELKTRPSDANVERFIEAVDNPVRREEARIVCAMMERVTGQPPVLWGPSIVGFGSYRYTTEAGHSGEWCRIGFSPRKAQLVVYSMPGFDGQEELLARMGKYATGKSCLYLKKLADVDMAALEELAARSWEWMNARYPDEAATP